MPPVLPRAGGTAVRADRRARLRDRSVHRAGGPRSGVPGRGPVSAAGAGRIVIPVPSGRCPASLPGPPSSVRTVGAGRPRRARPWRSVHRGGSAGDGPGVPRWLRRGSRRPVRRARPWPVPVPCSRRSRRVGHGRCGPVLSSWVRSWRLPAPTPPGLGRSDAGTAPGRGRAGAAGGRGRPPVRGTPGHRSGRRRVGRGRVRCRRTRSGRMRCGQVRCGRTRCGRIGWICPHLRRIRCVVQCRWARPVLARAGGYQFHAGVEKRLAGLYPVWGAGCHPVGSGWVREKSAATRDARWKKESRVEDFIFARSTSAPAARWSS